jgi:hypothetical protein
MVQAAVSMLVVFGLGAFVVDYSVLLVSRERAQAAADAAALAGAMALTYDDPGMVEDVVEAVVARLPVWFDGEAALPIVSFPAAEASGCQSGVPCVRVDVHRDDTEGSTPLPLFFARVLGVESSGVRATATAHAAVGNATPCLKPWAIPDTWFEGSVPPDNSFFRYDSDGMVVGTDSYIAPDDSDPGSGLTPFDGAGNPDDLGVLLPLDLHDPLDNGEPIIAGFVVPLASDTYTDDIAGCNGDLRVIGEQLPLGDAALLGAPTLNGLASLPADTASWNAATNNVEGGCAPGCAPISPRLVAVVVFDVDRYQNRRARGVWTDCPDAAPCIDVVNIVGLFLDNSVSFPLSARIARHPGLVAIGSQTVSQQSSFLPAVTLVR